MKKQFFLIFALSVSTLTTNSALAKQCTEPAYIKSIDSGYFEYGPSDPNNGNNIALSLSNGKKIPIKTSLNGDDPGGRLMIGMIKLAFALRLKVVLWDHHSPDCDDFDNIEIYRD